MKKNYLTIRKRAICFTMMLLFLVLSAPISSYAQYVRTQGTQIVDENGNPIFFAGMNLGNWLLWEGYLMMGDFNYRTHTQFFNSVKDAFGGDLQLAMEFEHQWRLNYVTNQTIVDLKNQGFNSVRVPFHYNLFWDGSNLTDRGFQYFDRVIEFCRNNNMYVLLDMHAAPGYQNPGDHCDNMNSNASQPRGSVQFWDGNNVNIASQVWRHIANRYKNEPVIWGYDLINEPVPQDGREYELLPSLITMRNAIREVDNNHIIVAEGSWWGSDMQKIDWKNGQTQSQTGVTSQWDHNLVYQTHHYSNDISALNDRLAITNNLNIPLILGEYGENSDNVLRQMTDWCINNNVGYFPWSFKKMFHDKTLWTINGNAAYNRVRDYINYGGSRPANAYNDMISFCQNNIANGSPGIVFHQGFYNAVKFTGNTSNPPPSSNAPVGQTIWLRGNNGQYVSSEDGQSPIMCNRGSAGGWEQFAVVDAGGGKIALRGNNGQYVSSENGQYPMMCNRNSISGWEAFDWVDAGGGKIALRGFNGQYVSSEDGQNAMMCNRPSIGGWEQFTFGSIGMSSSSSVSQNEKELIFDLISTNGGASAVEVYPNPVTDNHLTIRLSHLSNKGPVVIEIRDSSGKTVHSEEVSKEVVTVNTDAYKGIYIVQVRSGKESFTKKIIIQ